MREKVVGANSLYRSIRPQSATAPAATAYFFSSAYQGTKSLTWVPFDFLPGVVPATNVTMYCIPGVQYTASVYLLQTSGTIQRLQVDGGILNTNPFFATGISDWTPTGGTLAYTTTVHTGVGAMAITPDGVSAGAFAQAGTHRVTGGANYTASGWFYGPVYAAGVDMRINWYDAASGYLSTGASTATPLPGTTWTRVSHSYTAPANAVFAAVHAIITGTPPASQVTVVDEVMLTPDNAVTPGTTTTAQLTWVRLSVTWVATRPTHTMSISPVGTVIPGRLYMDNLQQEIGGTATAFTTTGPTIYPVFTGYVERWPAQWRHQGMYGYAAATLVDALAMLASQVLDTEHRNSVMAKAPDYYWPLSEPTGATSFTEVSGHGGPPLLRDPSKYGAGTDVGAGATMNIPGDPGGSGVTFTPGNTASPYQIATILGTGPTLGGSPPIKVPATIGTSWAVTISAWVAPGFLGSGGAGTQYLLNIFKLVSAGLDNPMNYGPIAIQTAHTPSVIFENAVNPIDYLLFGDAVTPIDNGALHHIAATTVQDTTFTTVTLHINGSIAGGNVAATSTMGGMLGAPADTITVGGYDNSAYFTNVTSGPIAHVAVWNRELTGDELQDLYLSGLGYPGEDSSNRIGRDLSYSYVAPLNIGPGLAVMGASDLSAGTSVLDAVQAATTSENGVLYVDTDGTITFEGRLARYLRTTATWVFGERADLGEIPYEENIGFDYDNTQVYNDVQVQNSGGITALGGVNTEVAASRLAYGRRNFTRSVNVSDTEAQAAADWIAAGHLDAHQRVQAITINPAANPALWPAALGIRIGDRVTVNRRTTAFTMSADYFVEQVGHDRAADKWEVTYQLSPFSATRQPWLLEDATYGQLGITTVLGY